MGKIYWPELTVRQQDVNSLLCTGLDPVMKKLPRCVRNQMVCPDDEPRQLLKWACEIVEATAPYTSVYKPNRAYWEGFCVEGEEVLRQVVKYIHEKHPGIPVFVDCKRGDIFATQTAYAEAQLGIDGFDGMNFSPYMGRDTFDPLVDWDESQDDGVNRTYVGLCYTSNPSARAVQNIMLERGIEYWEYIAESILRWAVDRNAVDRTGLVMAAAHKMKNGNGIKDDHLSNCRRLLKDRLWFLIPGIGTQGGFVEQTVEAAFRGAGSIAINSSSGITFASEDDDYAKAAAGKAEELRDQIRAAGGNC